MSRAYIVFLLICLIACAGDSQKAHTIDPDSKEQASIPNTSPGQSLPDYSKLFSGTITACLLTSPEDIAINLSLTVDRVVLDKENASSCYYDISLEDGSQSSIRISFQEVSKNDVSREVSNYMTNENGLEHQRSKDGDSHLCIRQRQGFLFIYNTRYAHTIQISFGSALRLKGLSNDQKAFRKTIAIAIAESILTKNNGL